MTIKQPVVLFGAGATKACGGPLTNEILPHAFDPEFKPKPHPFLDHLDQFLVDEFHLPKNVAERKKEQYPGLPLLLSLIDTAIDRKQPLGSKSRLDDLLRLRAALEFTIFAVLDHDLRKIPTNHYAALFKRLLAEVRHAPSAITLNYDIIADRSLRKLTGQFPDYGCDVATAQYRKQADKYELLKLHGSLNWIYCPGCHQLDVGVSKSGWQTEKVLYEIYNKAPDSTDWYSAVHKMCKVCGAGIRPVMITPTTRKDYRNPHIAAVWYRAERLLQRANRVIIVGYSLPEDDVEVIYLLKRGLKNVDPKQISVVEFDEMDRGLEEHPVGQRYRSLFGPDIEWSTKGFDGWLKQYAKKGRSILTRK
ncbi:MAG TPA: hypothetical protein VEO54_30825 [Thermoanaerobaculia bacterium]|nr:hypothetical protein [Thermoanaerobaculia bacterium]